MSTSFSPFPSYARDVLHNHNKYVTKMAQLEPTAACSCAPRHMCASAAGRCISYGGWDPANRPLAVSTRGGFKPLLCQCDSMVLYVGVAMSLTSNGRFVNWNQCAEVRGRTLGTLFSWFPGGDGGGHATAQSSLTYVGVVCVVKVIVVTVDADSIVVVVMRGGPACRARGHV